MNSASETNTKTPGKKQLDIGLVKKLGEGAALEPKVPVTEKKRSRGGRPKKEVKASRLFNVVFYQEDYDALEKNAEKMGMPVSQYIKALIRQGGGFDKEEEN